MGYRRLFDSNETFGAMYAAEAFLKSAGFSVGRNQRGEPRGILYGDHDIQKWRNLRAADRAALHGRMIGDMRTGPVWVMLADRLPDDASRSLERALKAEGR
jgi:hypothetical protein